MSRRFVLAALAVALLAAGAHVYARTKEKPTPGQYRVFQWIQTYRNDTKPVGPHLLEHPFKSSALNQIDALGYEPVLVTGALILARRK